MAGSLRKGRLRIVTIGPLPPGFGGLLPPEADVTSLSGGRLAPLESPARAASLAVVSTCRSFAAAAVAQRTFRVPWVAALDDKAASSLHASPQARVCLRQAQAVVATPSVCDRLRPHAPHARWVDSSDPKRVTDVLRDVAASPDARGSTRRGLGPGIVATWMFVDGRCERLAIRLVKVTGKAAEPVHPKHLVADAPWHHWYDDAIDAGSRLLDVGCNNGVHLIRLAPRLASGVGVDVNSAELERARRTAARLEFKQLEFLLGDLTDERTFAELAGERFDVVLLLDVLEHVTDRHQLLGRIRGLLRPGGRLLVAVPNVDTRHKRARARLGGVVYADPDHKIEYTEPLLRTELMDAGFSVESVGTGGFDTPFAGASTLIAPLSMRLYSSLARRRGLRAATQVRDATAFRVVASRSPAG